MEKLEIDQMQAWLHKVKANKKDSFPALTPHEYSCCVEDIRVCSIYFWFFFDVLNWVTLYEDFII